METAAQPHLRGESWTAAQPQLRGESSTAGRPQLASAAAEHADDWFTAPRSRVAALLAFFVLSEAAGILRSGARAYFYRTGAVCICPQLLAPGDEGWSGSRYCGDADAVILHATRLSSDLLLLQLGLDVLVTPLFAALADKWSCVGVIAFHIAAGCLALAGYAATAAHVPAAAEAWLTEREGEGDWDLASPLPLNGTKYTSWTLGKLDGAQKHCWYINNNIPPHIWPRHAMRSPPARTCTLQHAHTRVGVNAHANAQGRTHQHNSDTGPHELRHGPRGGIGQNLS